MSPAEKLDEIVRALEEDVAYLESAHIDNLRARDVAKRLSRALTLARELRDGAVEGFVDSEIAKDPGEIMSCDGEITVWIDDNGLSVPALLITEPTP